MSVAPSTRKEQVLALLADRGPASTGEIADEIGVSMSNCRNVLRRLRDQRCIESATGEVVPGNGRRQSTHSITTRGRDRLQHYRQS